MVESCLRAEVGRLPLVAVAAWHGFEPSMKVKQQV
jgi:hypothetical protein